MPDIEPICVLAAGSLRGVLPDLCQAFAQCSGQPIDLKMGPTIRLRERIEKGERCDLFISSDRQQAQHVVSYLGEGKLLDWIRTSMSLLLPAHGKAAGLIPPEQEGLLLQGLPAWLRLLTTGDMLIGISNPQADPAGLYALQVIERAARYDPQLPERIQSRLKPLIGGCAKEVKENQQGAGYLFTTFGCDVFLGYSHFARAAVRNNSDLRFMAIPPVDNVGCQYVFAELHPCSVPHVEFLLSPDRLGSLSVAGFQVAETR